MTQGIAREKGTCKRPTTTYAGCVIRKQKKEIQGEVLMITNKTVLPGAWYAIPLRRPESYGVGVITHTNPSHSHLIGYFFGPPRTHHPTLYETVSYRSTDAVLVARFGFGAAQWPLLGHDPNWASALWPMPIFGRIVIPPGIGVKVEYADTDPATIVRETLTTVN